MILCDSNCLLILSGKVTILIALIVLLYALWEKNSWNKALKVYWIFLFFSLMSYFIEQVFIWSVDNYTDFLLPFLKAWNIGDTNFLRIIIHLNNFICLGWFFSLVTPSKKPSKWFKRLSIILVILVVVNYCFIEGYNIAGGFNSSISAFYCVICPLVFMWYLFNQDTELSMLKNPYFWINLGLIIPCAISLFFYFSGDVIYKTDFPLFVNLSIGKNCFEIFAQIVTT